MVAENPVDEKPCEFRGSHALIARDEVGGTSKAVANNEDGTVAMGDGEFDYEVHQY